MSSLGRSTSFDSTFGDAPGVCPECGTRATVGEGMCVGCLLREGLVADRLDSKLDFETVLREAKVPDQQWQLGTYEILNQIGRGGMGVIYRARQRHSARIVALKRVLAQDADAPEVIERFRREAQAAASLDHPNILPIYEVSETEDGLPYFSMKLAAGGSLRDVGPALRKDTRKCVALMIKVSRAVAHAHAQGILHRDLQPGNILLDVHGEPLVSDFGLAKWLTQTSDLTRTLTAFGTPGYIAPEQTEGPAGAVTAAADIYSLGAILFYLLANRPPFVGANAISVIRQAADTSAPTLRAVSIQVDRDLEIIVARCLERQPTNRYESASALADDMQRWLEGRPIVARPVRAPERFVRWCRREPAMAIAAAVCVALSIAVTALVMLRWGTAAPEKSVAVLPFENLSGQQDEFFTDGIQEEILTSLGKVGGLKVISRSSVRDFKPGKRNLHDIASALGVRHLVEGTVRRADGRVRVSAQLTDARSGAQLWAENYDRAGPEVFFIENEIAQQIAEELKVKLSPEEEATLKAPPTADMQAYELYVHAKELAELAGLSSAERIGKQTELLNQAIARDPRFVPALCLLARVHVLAYWANIDHTSARLQAAYDALDAGARLQPSAGEVHLTRGIVRYWGKREYAAARAELALARRALPNDADVPFFMGLIARRQGDWPASTAFLEEARTTDPRNDTIIFELTRTNYFATKRYRDAAESCDSVLARKPDSFDFALARAKVDLASAGDLTRLQQLLRGDEFKSAEAELLAFEQIELALLERDYAAAQRALAGHRLPDFNWAGYVSPNEWYEGLIAEGLGDHERAQAEFTRAREILKEIVAARPDDAKAHIVLAEISTHLGLKDEAVKEGELALSLRPISVDAVDGADLVERLGAVYAQVGMIDRALDLVEQSAKLPNGPNYGSLKLEQRWDPLRGHPRFQRVLDSLGPPRR